MLRGHDWHGTSHLNVRSALKNMVKMSGVPSQYMKGVRPDIARIIYSGILIINNWSRTQQWRPGSMVDGKSFS